MNLLGDIISGGPIPGPVMDMIPIAIEIAKKAVKCLKALFKPPKKNETPEDVAERNAAYLQFCELVNREASQTEHRILVLLDESIRYYESLNEEPAFLRHKLSTKSVVRQLNLLRQQIPNLIASEVSKRLNDSDPECQQIRRMLPGQEKEARMREFLADILKSAVETCYQTIETVMDAVQEDMCDALESAHENLCAQLEEQKRELLEMLQNQDDPTIRQTVLNRARATLVCCNLIAEQLKEAEEYGIS